MHADAQARLATVAALVALPDGAVAQSKLCRPAHPIQVIDGLVTG